MRNGMDVQNVLDALFLLAVADWAFDSFPQACAGHLPDVRVVSKRRHRQLGNFLTRKLRKGNCGS